MSKTEQQPKSKMHVSAGDRALEISCYVIFAIAALLCVYPFYYVVINTISANDASANGLVNFLPQGLHFKNYTSAFKNIEGLFTAFEVSVARTVIGTVCTVFASAYLGFLFTQEKMWHRKLWYRMIVATMYFNAGIIPWYLTMKELHLNNNFLCYILPVVVSPFNLILTKTFVESIPKELQEAAEIDGASVMKVFFKIIIPVIKPIMATVAIFSAVNQWNAFQDTLLLVTNSKLYPLQYVLYQYLQKASSMASMAKSSSGSMSSLAAAAQTTATATSVRMTVTVIVVLPIMLVYPFFQRYFVKGIMIGAVKG